MNKSKEELAGLVEPFLLEKLNRNQFSCYETSASKLLKHTRFDLAFKLAFLELSKKAPEFAKDFYKEHIRAFSLGAYNEPGNEDKNTIDSFYESFEKTFQNIKNNGFDEGITLIPVSRNGTIINGAHRVASSIFLEKTVHCVDLEELSEPNYNYNFFYKRNVPVNYLDFAATKFVEYAENSYIAFIWPTAKGKDAELESIIPNIIYRKNMQLHHQGAHNLLSQIYYGEPWLGTVENDFQGAKGKLVECFKSFDPVRVIAFQAENLDDVLEIKEKIRELFGVGKHSVHITDTHEEAKRVAQAVFNKNSVHFLNYAKPNKYLNTHKKLDGFKQVLNESSTAFYDAVLDGDVVLSMYGLRECSDIDYLSSIELEHHDLELEHHDLEKEELIYNPSNYFFFNNLKFISLKQIYKMKKNRAKANGDAKDINDYKIIEAVLERNAVKEYINRSKQSVYYAKIKLKPNLLLLLRKTGLYNYVRALYRGLKRVL